jgi:hypothetical protein
MRYQALIPLLAIRRYDHPSRSSSMPIAFNGARQISSRPHS